MRVFVFTDNLIIYQAFKPLLEKYDLARLDFYCSENSRNLLEIEIGSGRVIPWKLRDNFSELLNYDLGFSCHSKQIFPAELVHKVRCINIHPGLNPYNRGWYPQAFSLINKLPLGATIHEMDEEIDHGPIICQERVALDDWDTSMSAYNKVQEKEISLFAEWLPTLLKGDYKANRPAEEGNYNRKTDFSNLCEIDLDKKLTFREAIDYLRAMSHPPYFNAYYKSGAMTVWVRLEVKHAAEQE
jgi:methionyl-tRNA formyltransferase